VIAASGIELRAGSRLLLDNATFRIAAGDRVGLVGRNGAGKSSLVRCIVGEQRSASGSVALFGEDVWRHRVTLMERCGVVAEVI
jgi:ABC-type multidrug transport system ATPase subunit